MSPFSYCKIFPSIGIARLGNSPTEFFIGPETPRLAPNADGSFKDNEGRVKRQAARFRVYAFNEEGNVGEAIRHALFAVMQRANIRNEEECHQLLLKMRDEGLVKFDINTGYWRKS